MLSSGACRATAFFFALSGARSMLAVRTVARAAMLLLLGPTLGQAQALTSITSLYVTFSTRRITANPSGALKAQLDSLDQDLLGANRAGQVSQVRRLLAKGNVLLTGRAWTDVADFGNSLLLRSDRVVVESQIPYVVRLEQLYAPTIDLPRSLTAHATLTARTAGTVPVQPARVVKDLGAFDGVSRDLRESPLVMEFDLRDVADGRYVVVVDVSDSARTLGSTTLNIAVRHGIEESVRTLERAAAQAPEVQRAELLFPIDRLRNVNRGRLELRTWDLEKDFAVADTIRRALLEKRDPFATRTGDMKRHYVLDAAHEIMPYRLYVPTMYVPTTPMPLIVALHGLGSTEDTFFDAYGKRLPVLAEEHGYIVASPLGYRVDGGYGSGVEAPSTDVVARRNSDLSELDVMQVLATVRKLYNIDPDRIYLMGHSMGAIGTFKLAAKYADVWAAIGAFSGQGTPASVERMKNIPAFVVHGDADPTVNVRGSRTMVDAMKVAHVDVTYIEVAGGNHTNVVEPHLAGMMQFFNARKKSVVSR